MIERRAASTGRSTSTAPSTSTERATSTGCAVSTALKDLVDGPPHLLDVVHRSSRAWQLADASGRVVASLVTREAIRLPHSGVVTSLPGRASHVVVGAGSWSVGGARLRVSRWWSPARPSLPGLASLIDDRAVAELTKHWRAHLGQGAGLTPYADDVVCGALVTMLAARHRCAKPLAAAVTGANLESATTATSAALLRAAAKGYCIDQVAAYLTARARRVESGGPELAEVQRCRADLEQVGHSSGQGLLEGIHLLLHAPPAAGSRVAA